MSALIELADKIDTRLNLSAVLGTEIRFTMTASAAAEYAKQLRLTARMVDEVERLRVAIAAQQDGAREAVIEECAKVATGVMYNGTTTEYQVGWNGACDYIAAKLRSRPEQ